CPRRDDGGGDGDWEHAADFTVAGAAAVHDGGGHCQRVHGSGTAAVPRGARRDWAGAVRHHADRERAVAAAHLGHDAMSLGRGRRFVSRLFVMASAASVVAAVVPLLLVLGFVVMQGIRAISIEFFTQLPASVGEPGGGMANAILGTVTLTVLASAMAVPIG